MPTATMDRDVHVSEMSETKRTGAAVCDLQEQRSKLEAAIAGCYAPTDDPIAKAEGELRALSLRPDLLKTKAALARAQRAAEAARASDVATLRAKFHALKRAEVPRVVDAMRKAQDAMNRLRALELAEHEATGGYVDFMAWSDLAPNRDGLFSFTSRLDEWVERLRAQGLLADD